MCSLFISLQVWNCETGIVRLTFQIPPPGSFANSCIFSEDSSMILFGGTDSVVYVHDNGTGNLISRFETCGCIIAILGTAGKYVIHGYYKFCCLNVQCCILGSVFGVKSSHMIPYVIISTVFSMFRLFLPLKVKESLFLIMTNSLFMCNIFSLIKRSVLYIFLYFVFIVSFRKLRNEI